MGPGSCAQPPTLDFHPSVKFARRCALLHCGVVALRRDEGCAGCEACEVCAASAACAYEAREAHHH